MGDSWEIIRRCLHPSHRSASHTILASAQNSMVPKFSGICFFGRINVSSRVWAFQIFNY